LAILCTYIETQVQNWDATMEAEIIVVFYGMSVDRSRKVLRYVRIVAAGSRSNPTIAFSVQQHI